MSPIPLYPEQRPGEPVELDLAALPERGPVPEQPESTLAQMGDLQGLRTMGRDAPRMGTRSRASSPPSPQATSRLRESWVTMGIGAATAPLLGVLPLFGWFLGALCHEMGHTFAALLAGRPAVPRINPTGEALTTYSDPSLFLTFFVPALCGLGLWRLFAGTWRIATLSALGLLVIALHWNPALPKIFFLCAGHLGELLIASIFLWRAWTGGFTESKSERVLFGTAGFFLVGSNLKLTIGLMTSAASRAWYRGPGAGACENDYVRLARDFFGWELESVALLMTLPALLVIPLAIWLGQWALGSHAQQEE